MEYVPRAELEKRWVRVRRFMDCDSLVILQNADLYYLSGTVQTGVALVPARRRARAGRSKEL